MELPVSIAIVGKGGVGKSVITTLIAKVLSEDYSYRILLIDADPSYPHLSKMVDLEPNRSLEEIRTSTIKKVVEDEKSAKKIAENIDFEVYKTIAENKRFSLFSMGQPEDPGCFCPSNALLRKVIESISRDFDIVLIDCEAGLEQISRLVIKTVDIILIVTDISIRSIDTAISIEKNARKFTDYKMAGIIINKERNDISSLLKKIQSSNITLLATIPEDINITRFELEGKPLIELPTDTPSLKSVKALVDSLLN